MKNFHKVRPNLYRGGKPSLADLLMLKRKFGIKRIISLDVGIGQDIDPFCNKLDIEHIIIHLNVSYKNNLKNLLKYNIHNLVDSNIPTFVHCIHGRDRTGLFIALVRCSLDHWDCNKALKEAKILGFGTGMTFKMEKFYIKLICKACNHSHIDSNHAYDIVSNVGDMDAQFRDETFDSYNTSWAPYADKSQQEYPYQSTNTKEYDEQYPSREEYGIQGMDRENTNVGPDVLPNVGIYDQNAQITNLVGPSSLTGGFL